MVRTGRAALYTSGVIASIAVLYGLPTVIEHYCLPRFGPIAACVFIGNLLGCVVLAAISWKRALALYLSLGALEFLLLRFGIISAQSMVWLTDIVPTFLVARMAVALLDVVSTPPAE